MSKDEPMTYRLVQLFAIISIIFTGAILIWPINKILSLVMVMVALYLLVMKSGVLDESQPRTMFDGHVIRYSSPRTSENIERFSGPNRLLRQGHSTHVAFFPSSLYDSDTTPLSEPRHAMEIEIPLPPSVVIDTEPLTDQDFANVGIRTLRDLADVDSFGLDEGLDIDDATVEDLIFQANLLYYGANIRSLMDLVMMTPDEVVHKILTGEYHSIYASLDREDLLEHAERWIKKGKSIMTKSLSDFFKGRMR